MTPDPFARISQLHAELARAYLELAQRDDRRDLAGADRVVGLAEAATRLGCSRSWLSRRASWARLGGYKDLDGRVKFAESRLRAHLAGAATDGRG